MTTSHIYLGLCPCQIQIREHQVFPEDASGTTTFSKAPKFVQPEEDLKLQIDSWGNVT